MKIKKYLEEVISIKTSPHAFAMGFAIGTFICVLPLPGLTLPLATLMMFIYRNVNKFALFGSLLIWNPFVMIPINYLSYRIGDALLGDSNGTTVLMGVYNISKRLFLGSIIVGLIMALLIYLTIIYISLLRKANFFHFLTRR